MMKAIVIAPFLLIFCFVGCVGAESDRPNVLFICIDDLRPELGCYGNDIIISPNLDKLASQGRVFTNHFVTVPTCGASRYSMLTGTLPSTKAHVGNHAIRELISGKQESAKPETFIHHLRRNGYYTVGIGKISHYADGLLYGYEDQVSDKLELPYSWDENVFNAGKWKTGWNAFFAYADGSNRQSKNKQVTPYECGDVDDRGYPDGLTAELAVKKLEELSKKKQPFFLGVGFFKPHLPFNAPKKYWDMYDESKMPLAESKDIPANVHKASLHGSGEFNGYKLGEEKASLDKSVSDGYARKIRHAYYASVSYADAQVGKVLDQLEKLGLAENTIVVVWGDHGWHLGDHRVWGKHTIFERALKSAFIVKTPNMRGKGVACERVVSTVDIYPTLMDMCGIEMPYEMAGKSLETLLDEPNGDLGQEAAYSYFRNGISLRTERYRLTRYFRKNRPTVELYDHKNDPYETINIAQDNPGIVKQLMPVWQKGNTGLYGSE